MASTSTGFAWTIGKPDYAIKRDGSLQHLATLSKSVALPVNADFEAGFASDPDKVMTNVGLAVNTRVSGRSIAGAMMSNPIGNLRVTAEPTPSWRLGFGGVVLLDPKQAGLPHSAGTWKWSGLYGHHWFVHPEEQLTVVALSNTAIAGSGWLFGSVKLNSEGFILTSSAKSFENTPYATSVPGIYAVDVVRADSVKRVASAVGEGSMVISYVHQDLSDSAVLFSSQAPRQPVVSESPTLPN